MKIRLPFQQNLWLINIAFPEFVRWMPSTQKSLTGYILVIYKNKIVLITMLEFFYGFVNLTYIKGSSCRR